MDTIDCKQDIAPEHITHDDKSILKAYFNSAAPCVWFAVFLNQQLNVITAGILTVYWNSARERPELHEFFNKLRQVNQQVLSIGPSEQTATTFPGLCPSEWPWNLTFPKWSSLLRFVKLQLSPSRCTSRCSIVPFGTWKSEKWKVKSSNWRSLMHYTSPRKDEITFSTDSNRLGHNLSGKKFRTSEYE